MSRITLLLSLRLLVTPMCCFAQQPSAPPPNPQPKPAFEMKSEFDFSSLRPFTAGVPYLGGYETGLYPGAVNVMPAAHREAGEKIASLIQPLDTEGRADPAAGRVLALAVGHSNCSMYFRAFERVFQERRHEVHPRFELLNAAVGGQQLPEISRLEGGVWMNTVRMLSRPGYSPSQVQVLFLHTTYHPAGNIRRMPAQFPERMEQMQRDLQKVLAHCAQTYPNLRIAILTSDGFRHFTGFEPHVWQEAFGIKWMIERQINGADGTAYTGSARRLPWLMWGPYIWDNTWDRSYFTDGVHPAAKAQTIFVEKYWNFLKEESVGKKWFGPVERRSASTDGQFFRTKP